MKNVQGMCRNIKKMVPMQMPLGMTTVACMELRGTFLN